MSDREKELERFLMERIKECDDLNRDMNEAIDLCDRLSALLRGVAIALKGDERALHSHSWHDLPEVARQTMDELKRLRGQHGN